MPKNKITIGMATYGRSFTLSNPRDNGVGATAWTGPAGPVTRGQGFWSYYEVVNINLLLLIFYTDYSSF